MNTTPYTCTILRPEPGNYLTQADPATPPAQRIITDEIWLGVGDTPDAWREITPDQAQQLRLTIPTPHKP